MHRNVREFESLPEIIQDKLKGNSTRILMDFKLITGYRVETGLENQQEAAARREMDCSKDKGSGAETKQNKAERLEKY